MAIYAVIDVGTNSVKFHMAEKSANGTWNSIRDTVEITRLGEGIQRTGNIKPAAMDRTITALTDMLTTAHHDHVVQIAAVGTMCLRTANNAADFIARVQEACGLTIDVIPGEEEARLAYLAVKSGLGLNQGNLVIFDIGGGSTEFILGNERQIHQRFSLNIGAVRYTEDLLTSDPVTPEELRQTLAAVDQDFAEQLSFPGPITALVGIGGTVTNLSSVKQCLRTYDPSVVQGSILECAELDRQISLYQSKTVAERKRILGLQPKRADVILAGAIIVRVIMTKIGVTSFTVSDRGLRHGLLVDRFG